MNTIHLSVEAGAPAPADNTGQGVTDAYRPLWVDLSIDGKLLATTRQGGANFLAVLPLLTLQGRMSAYILSCVCGIHDCARIESPVHVRMTAESVVLEFPREYAEILTNAGLYSGPAREVTFTFERTLFDEAIATLQATCLQLDTQEYPVTFGDPVHFRTSTLQSRLTCEAEAVAKHASTKTWVSRGPGSAPYLVVPPISRAGMLPNFIGALEPLPAAEKGRQMGVGSPRNHLIYRFNFDERSGRGTWSYVYAEVNGVPCAQGLPC